MTPGRNNLPLSATRISTNTAVEDPKDDTPVEEVILPPLGERSTGATKMVPPSRDNLAATKILSTAHKQTFIATYFASVGGVP